MAVAQVEIVLPVECIALGEQIVRQVVLLDPVLDATQRHAGRPDAGTHVIDRDGRQRIAEVLIERGQEEIRILRGACRLPVTQTDLRAPELLACECVERQVLESAIGRVDRTGREAPALDPAQSGADLAGVTGHAREQVGFARFVRAGARAHLKAAALRCPPGDHVDHATDRIGPVQRRTRAPHDLDTLDQFRRNVLQRGAADRAGIDAHAVDQHQGMVAFRAANEDRGRLSRAARAPDIEPGVESQYVDDVGGEAARERFAIDHGHWCEHRCRRGRCPRRGHDQRFDRIGRFGGRDRDDGSTERNGADQRHSDSPAHGW